jgi:hypothetical protein
MLKRRATIGDLDRRIAAIREDLRQLIETAAAGAGDGERNADQIAYQEDKFELLLRLRDELLEADEA